MAPRWVLLGWWVRIGEHCPFTIHVPSAMAGSDCIPVTKRQQRDGGRKLHCHVKKNTTDHLLIFTTTLHSDRVGSSPCSKLHDCDITPAVPILMAAINLVDLNPAL